MQRMLQIQRHNSKLLKIIYLSSLIIIAILILIMITPKEVNGEDLPIKLVKPPLFPSLELRDQGSQLIIKN